MKLMSRFICRAISQRAWYGENGGVIEGVLSERLRFESGGALVFANAIQFVLCEKTATGQRCQHRSSRFRTQSNTRGTRQTHINCINCIVCKIK